MISGLTFDRFPLNIMFSTSFFYVAVIKAILGASLLLADDGFEVAKQIWNNESSLTDVLQRNVFGPLEFRFHSTSHINGWWCVKMYENGTPGWQDNYLCTNKDIGLTWNWSRGVCPTINSITGLAQKCVWMPEPHDPQTFIWADNALCLPRDSRIELVWSWCGPIPQMSCVHLYDRDAPAVFNDNYICWREN